MKRSTIMKYRLLGKSGLRVSEAALGTMTFGDEWGWGSPKAEAEKVYETYREAGGNFIDTANFYTGGTSERFVGEFIQGHRESVSWRRNTPTPRQAMIRMRRAITARA
jgi:aryl-alcohol dehydrogenase-like predicted oxidoreductase